MIILTINGRKAEFDENRHRTILHAVREGLMLSGTKYGCGEGQCGACTVLLDGKPVKSCITPLRRAANRAITTIEGLADGNSLHPVQQAFLETNAMQCGYCIPGMILTTVALLEENSNPGHDEIAEKLNGNICRCCNYPKITAAVERARNIIAGALK